MSLVRAWVRGHHGPAVAATSAGLTAVLLLGAGALMPVPGEVVALPVWQLTPTGYALLSAFATVNRLPEVAVDRRLWRARSVWLTAVTASAAGGAWLVDARSGLPSLVPATALLVVVSFGASVVVGRWAVWVGGLAALWILFHVADYASTVTTPWQVPSGLRLGVLVAVAGIAVAAYVVRGGRVTRA